MNKPLHRSKTRLQGESLELRKMLDASGALWNLDADQYTISFADDGTNVGPKQSSLYTELAHLGAPEVWQEAILRGFQTWARHTNVDLIVVDDDGTDFGARGDANGDPRFGDIRVAAVPFRNNISSHVIPTDQPNARTWTGDFVLNSDVHIQTLDDLYVISIHEAGHVFGLEHSEDINSPMFGLSFPTSTTPTESDLENLASIYPRRSPDFYDDVPAQASGVPDLEPDLDTTEIVPLQLELSTSNTPMVIFGDIQSSDDVDAYRVSEIADGKELLAVTLFTENISLLRATLNVRSGDGDLLASVPFSERTGAGQVIELQDLGSVDQSSMVIEVVTSAGASPYDAGGYTVVLQQGDAVDLPDEVPVISECFNRLAHSGDRSLSPSTLGTYSGACQSLDDGEGVPQFIIDIFQGAAGAFGGSTAGIEPVDPTEASFCNFDWLDDLFSCVVWGDLDGDGQVTFADFLRLSVNFGSEDAQPEEGDLDGDRTVGFADFLILSRSFGEPVRFNSIDDIEIDIF